MSVLVVAPHPDDETIGCGGSILLATSGGDEVNVVFLTSGELGVDGLPELEARKLREGEAADAAARLGLADLVFLRHRDWFLHETVTDAATELRRAIDRHQPTEVWFPHAEEWHPDHAACASVVERALPREHGLRLRTYEVWTPMSRYDDVADISAVMDKKLAALRCYRSQLDTFRYDDAVTGLNRFRGALAARCAYAEVFGEVGAHAPAQSS